MNMLVNFNSTVALSQFNDFGAQIGTVHIPADLMKRLESLPKFKGVTSRVTDFETGLNFIIKDGDIQLMPVSVSKLGPTLPKTVLLQTHQPFPVYSDSKYKGD